MAITVCWSVKGGSGATVVAAAMALVDRAEVVLIDLDGELPAVLGMAEPRGQGVGDWLESDAPAAALDDLSVSVDATTRLVPRGGVPIDREHRRWAELADALAGHRARVIIDAGTGAPPPSLLVAGARGLLVTRACYLALRRAATMACRPAGVVLVVEPGRALRTGDVEAALGAPVVASVSHDPAVARAVDAGLLLARLPRGLARDLRGAA